MTTFQAVTPSEAHVWALGLSLPELTNAAKAKRDWALAEALDAKADVAFASGDAAKGKYLRTRALGAANRAVRFSDLANQGVRFSN
jgi:hypothetical protein